MLIISEKISGACSDLKIYGSWFLVSGPRFAVDGLWFQITGSWSIKRRTGWKYDYYVLIYTKNQQDKGFFIDRTKRRKTR